jgi:hypothetical protein
VNADPYAALRELVRVLRYLAIVLTVIALFDALNFFALYWP